MPRPDRSGLVVPSLAKICVLWYNSGLLDPTLPIGFDSWTQVLSDWAVQQAFSRSKLPGCFKGRSDLAVPFVSAIGAAIRRKQLDRRATETALVVQQVTEPTYDRLGGTEYREVRAAMEDAQDRYFEFWRNQRPTDSEADSPQLVALRAAMERNQTAFERVRRRHEREVQETGAKAVRAHWADRQVRGFPDTFFADAAQHSVAARMQRIHPPWWGAFLGRLQRPLSHGHPAEGFLLDVRPRLRIAARKKTLAALIDEWRAEHNDRWGWYGKAFDWVLAERADRKAKELVRWCNARAPGYLARNAVRRSLDAELAELLAAADPWPVPLPERRFGQWSEYWRN